MNRFRKNKKAKGDGEDVESTSSFASSLKSSKKNKKAGQDVKPVLDLSQALPSEDDFRTSLIMPKLSARFSMLREQDDPNTKIGKASDDSVLFPKRASRLDVLGQGASLLSDIDEVASIEGRSSFTRARAESFISGYGTDDDHSLAGGVMNRPRRGEGNNLFGGRQKVYKIPVRQSGANSDPARSGMSGRAVYEDDLTLSAFQRLRLKEKEERKAREANESTQQDAQTPEVEDTLSSVSANRTTYSSTASGPSNSRISTAATSVDEQPQTNESSTSANDDGHSLSKSASNSMLRNGGSVKSRRLYGDGLAQLFQDQQSSTFHRLESLSRQRAATPELHPPNRAFSRSAVNLHDRLHKLAISESSPSSRPSSPSPSVGSPKQQKADEGDAPKGAKSQLSPASAANGYGSIPPLSPPISENDENSNTLAAAVNPEDRGKATAMGIFNKPKAPFDEFQFIHRQIQMRQTPPVRRPSPPSRTPSQDKAGQPRATSTTSIRSRATSTSSRFSDGQQRTANRSTPGTRDASPAPPANDTFLANSSSSESGDDGEDRRSTKVSSMTSQELDGMHPAFRSSSSTKLPVPARESQDRLPEVRFSELADLKTIEENDHAQSAGPSTEDNLPEKPDSPTLGPAGLGLSGLIRTHLRQDSDRSSIFPPPSPKFSPLNGQASNDSPSSKIPVSPPRKGWNPAFEKNFADASVSGSAVPQPRARPDVSGFQMRPKWALNQAPSSAARPPNGVNGPSWQEEMNFGHRRGSSTETQREREEFAHELAERRKKVEEKLKNIAEAESRSASPVPGRQTPDHSYIRPGNAFSILKSRSAKNAPVNRHESRSLRALGFGTANASTPALPSDDSWREEEDRTPYGFGKHSNSSSPHIATRPRMPTISRSSQEESRGRGPSPPSYMSKRDRSTSDASGRSMSRTRHRDREDLEPLEEVRQDNDNSAFPDYHDRSSTPSVPSSTRPSVEVINSDRTSYEPSSSAASGRYRSGSRSTTASSYFDKPGHPAQPNPAMIGLSPRPSPIPSYCANTTPPLHEDPNAPAAAGTLSQRGLAHSGLQKRPVNKLQISEPTFVHSTSSVPVVGLPPGASLSNGMEAPPVPPMNPRRRRQTTTHTIFGALKGDKHESRYIGSGSEYGEEQSMFSDEEKKSKVRNRLRKMSSEGVNLKEKARAEANNMPASSHPPPPHFPPPAIPRHPTNIPMDGGMF